MIKRKGFNIYKKLFNKQKTEFDLLIFGIEKPSNFNLNFRKEKFILKIKFMMIMNFLIYIILQIV